MTVDDIPRILDGSLPISGLLSEDRDRVPTISQWLKHDMTRYVKSFKYVSEMEATIRVLSIICEVVEELPDIQIKLQPSLQNHSTYTDFLIYLESSGSPLLIIEVKKQADVALFGENVNTAQVLREAHLVLQDEKCKVQKLSFILTNAEIWSLGIAEKAGNKIKVTKCYNHLITYKEDKDFNEVDTRNTSLLLCKLKQIISQTI